mmetsp:Transcript_33766/g.95033  ORF Transcript_33766/g.95033 Transcript_33766/m.95033 type:complete len:245 (-) Transcript_33766:355-1089(-)
MTRGGKESKDAVSSRSSLEAVSSRRSSPARFPRIGSTLRSSWYVDSETCIKHAHSLPSRTQHTTPMEGGRASDVTFSPFSSAAVCSTARRSESAATTVTPGGWGAEGALTTTRWGGALSPLPGGGARTPAPPLLAAGWLVAPAAAATGGGAPLRALSMAKKIAQPSCFVDRRCICRRWETSSEVSLPLTAASSLVFTAATLPAMLKIEESISLPPSPAPSSSSLPTSIGTLYACKIRSHSPRPK